MAANNRLAIFTFKIIFHPAMFVHISFKTSTIHSQVKWIIKIRRQLRARIGLDFNQALFAESKLTFLGYGELFSDRNLPK